MAFQARIFNQQQLGYVIHTSVENEGWQLYSKGAATGNGAAGGTTVVDAQRAEADDFFNGRYWILITSGSAIGQKKRVVDFVQSSGTFTLENNGFPAQIVSGVTYEVWKSAEPVVVVDSSSGETNCVDAIRVEENDYWIGYYLVPITGSHRGKIAQITDHVASTGTMTLGASFGSALAAGDVCLIRRFVEASDISAGVTQEYVARPGNRVKFSVGDGIVGPRAGTISFNTQLTPSNGTAADGTRAQLSAVGHLLVAAGLQETVGTTEVCTAGSTTTSIEITTGTWEQFAIGMMVVINNEVGFITAITDGAGGDDILTITPALSSAPTAGDLVIATRMYSKTTSGDVYGVTLEWEVDGVRNTMTGCKGNVTMNSGVAPTLSFSFNVDDWVREIEAAPYNATTAYTSAVPVLEMDRIAYLSTTKTNIAGFTATPGTAVAPRSVQGSSGINGRCGFQVTNYAAGGTWQELLDNTGDIDQEIRWLARTEKDLIVVMGNNNDYAGVRIPKAKHIELPTPGNADGLVQVPCVYQAQDAGSTTDGASAIVKVPDWCICLT
jgi:hypothetical protein